MRGHFSDLSAAAYLTALNSLPLRRAWDKTAKDVRLLQVNQLPPPPPAAAGAAAADDDDDTSSSSSSSSGSGRKTPVAVHAVWGPEYEEIIYWRVGLPWPAQDRDFVFARRLRAYRRSSSSSSSSSRRRGDVYALVCGQLQVDLPELPETKEAVRVAFFEAAVVAFPDDQTGDKKGDTKGDTRGDTSDEAFLGGDPQKTGVTYIALHYDRSKSPVPSWLRSYVATQSLPAQMRVLRSTALQLLSCSGRVKDLGALRGPQGAPFTQEELLLLEQQHNIHSVQWGGEPDLSQLEGGAPPEASLLPPSPHQQQQQQQQQQECSDVAAIGRAPDSAAATAAAGAAATAAAAAAAAAELRQLIGGARGDSEATCASRPLAIPLIWGGPHELIRGAPPFIQAARVISEAIGGAPWWGPLKRVTTSPRWGPPQAAREALKWALRLRGPPWLAPPCACTDLRQSGGPPPRCLPACTIRGLLGISWGGPRGPPCPLSKATGLPCGHRALREVETLGGPPELGLLQGPPRSFRWGPLGGPRVPSPANRLFFLCMRCSGGGGGGKERNLKGRH
ncbi:hypothetical protein ACSSS7_000313 [Eimeria intestinalis]